MVSHSYSQTSKEQKQEEKRRWTFSRRYYLARLILPKKKIDTHTHLIGNPTDVPFFGDVYEAYGIDMGGNNVEQ